nr:hypothetical protein [uncultured Cohaesibacter sp.]
MLEKELPCEVVDIADCLNTPRYPVERIGFEAGHRSATSSKRLIAISLEFKK